MSAPRIVLAGDVGGTKTLLRLYGTAGETLFSARYDSARHPHLSTLVECFFDELERAGKPRPSVAVFGVAGPVVGGVVATTNLPWHLDERALAATLALDRVRLLNDFEASAYGVLGLPPTSLETLQVGERLEHAAIAVIGAGTGLGEALVAWVAGLDGVDGVDGVDGGASSGEYVVVPSEGGHTDFAPRDDLEIDLLRHLRARFGRVSWERVVSGQGIANVYMFLRDAGVAPERPEVAREMETDDHAAVIGRHALAGTDALCLRTIELFVTSYGAEAGNLALRGLARGGVYLTGGIAPKLLPKLREGAFLRSYRDKGRLSSVVEKAPVHVVLDQEVGLRGAEHVARRLA